jgi:hypothetical protein
MTIQVAEIGNINEFGLTQADPMRDEFVKDEVGEAAKEKIVFRRMVDPDRVFGYETLSITDDMSIQRMLSKVSFTDVIIALIDADNETKKAVYRNLTDQGRDYVKIMVNRIETGNAREIITEKSRNMISEAFIEMIRK